MMDDPADNDADVGVVDAWQMNMMNSDQNLVVCFF